MKVKCIGYETAERYFTLGKVYETDKNGLLTNDNGVTYDESPFKIGDWLSAWYKFEIVDETEFDFAKFKTGSIVVNCKTEEELIDFATRVLKVYPCMTMDRITGWFSYNGKDTCIRWDDRPNLVYCDKAWYMDKGYKITNWSDYMTPVEEPPVFVKDDFFVEITLEEVIALATEKLGKAVKIKK